MYAQNMEVIAPEAELRDLGKLSDLLSPELFDGSISPRQRLDSGEITMSEITDAKTSLNKFYVQTTPGSYKRCVDGRSRAVPNAQQESALGPQVQGGTIDEIVAKRLAGGVDSNDTLEADTATHSESFDSSYSLGAHTDTGAGETGFGCGAVKGQEAKLDYYVERASMEAIADITETICSMAGTSIPIGWSDKLQLSAANLKTIAPQYFAKKLEIIQSMQKADPESVALLEGSHNEVFLVLNFVKGTTLNTDEFNAQTGGKIQAFGLDVWNIIDEHREDAVFVLADSVATLMNLTDGSIEVLARVPTEAKTNQCD